MKRESGTIKGSQNQGKNQEKTDDLGRGQSDNENTPKSRGSKQNERRGNCQTVPRMGKARPGERGKTSEDTFNVGTAKG